MEAGRVWINCYNLFPSGAAFGGTKSSGHGREDAFETMLAFTQVKNVIADISERSRTFYQCDLRQEPDHAAAQSE